MKEKGFTLLELVVTIGIMSILLTIFLPSLSFQSNYLHRLAAETHLLAWQIDGNKPNDDRYYHYEIIQEGSKTSWSARTEHDGNCNELVLTDQSHEPNSCWPK
jgi:prepilin-type N-terminal cleavage/methylation domain-containing protein